MECPICFIEFSSDNRVPKLIPCGHTICALCVELLIDPKRKTQLTCPTCNKKHLKLVVKKLPTNYMLLDSAFLKWNCPEHKIPIDRPIYDSCKHFVCAQCILNNKEGSNSSTRCPFCRPSKEDVS